MIDMIGDSFLIKITVQHIGGLIAGFFVVFLIGIPLGFSMITVNITCTVGEGCRMLVCVTLVDAMWNHFGFGQTAQLPTSADRCGFAFDGFYGKNWKIANEICAFALI